MHIKSMEEYQNANQRYIAQITQNVMEELAEKKISDHKLLDSFMTYLKNMQKTMVELNSTLDFFTELSETGEPNEAYLEWLKSTVTFLQDTERDFIYMISSTSDTYDGFIEKVVPITETREPGIITLDVGIYLPNALKSKAKQINITAKLLDLAFEKQIKKQNEHWNKAYIFYEYHVAPGKHADMIRDTDNFDAKHLTDLISYYYLEGDGAENVKIANCVAIDEEDFTRAVVVKADFIDTYYEKKEGFFELNNTSLGGKD